MQVEQLGRQADELESQLGNIDSIRLDHQAAQRRAKEAAPPVIKALAAGLEEVEDDG